MQIIPDHLQIDLCCAQQFSEALYSHSQDSDSQINRETDTNFLWRNMKLLQQNKT